MRLKQKLSAQTGCERQAERDGRQFDTLRAERIILPSPTNSDPASPPGSTYTGLSVLVMC